MGKSSKDKRDAYYRLAKEQGWRARSAFKLLQLDEQFNLFAGVSRVVDLCAAPGSWSQVLSRVLIKGEKFGRNGLGVGLTEKKEGAKEEDGGGERIEVGHKEKTKRPEVRIIAVDLQPMASLEGITILTGDITHPSTPPRILAALDLVLSDGAPDVTGLHDLDIYVQSQLLYSALNLAIRVLVRGGTFVAKIFRGKDVDILYAQLRVFFSSVIVAKPRSSRASSLEAFVVCQGFELPKGYAVDDTRPLGIGDGGIGGIVKDRGREGREKHADEGGWVEGQRRIEKGDGITVLEFESDSEDDMRWVAPFVACGDLSAWDADATYRLPKDRVSLDPVQPPTAPPYKRALEERRRRGGLYGKTKGKVEGPLVLL